MSQTESVPLHQALLQDPERLCALYDLSAPELIEAVTPEGYFEGWDAGDLAWPAGSADHIGLEGLEKRAHLVDAIYGGVPELRDERLKEAYEQFSGLSLAYHQGNRIYLQLKEQFTSSGVGTAQDFLKLYQTLYVEALARGDDFSPDAAEEALARAKISRTPLSHAQAVAEALSTVVLDDDPRWGGSYSCRLDGMTLEGTLRDLLRDVAQRTLDYIAAGERLATRFNIYNNLGWFGSSVWKVVTDADLLLSRLAQQSVEDREREAVREDVRLGQSMLVEFFRAHREDPTKLRPENYWYWQPYSYLTRDMIDLSVRLVDRINALVRTADGSDSLEEMLLPPLLAGTAVGRFLDYPHVGKTAELTSFQRKRRFVRWARACWRVGRKRLKISKADLEPEQRYEMAWQAWLAWSRATMNCFDIRLKVTVDPLFAPIARDLDLASRPQKILFLPAHQGMLEHFVVFSVFNAPEFLEAMGWDRSVPFVQFARTGLARSTAVKIGPREISIFGMSPERFDQLFVDVDGYVTRGALDFTSHTIPRFLEAMAKRPGLIYPMGTTASFDVQLFPLQHALFAKLPQDIAIIPMVFRGSHSLWPRCPKGNLNINPGVIEAVILPPMLGETTLLPKRRSLRIQLEAANLFQAVHIATLLNPEKR